MRSVLYPITALIGVRSSWSSTRRIGYAPPSPLQLELPVRRLTVQLRELAADLASDSAIRSMLKLELAALAFCEAAPPAP